LSHSATAKNGLDPPHYTGFTITFRHTTIGRTPLDEWPTRRRDLYMIQHNIHKRQTSMSPAGLELIIPACERQQIKVLDGAGIAIVFTAIYYRN